MTIKELLEKPIGREHRTGGFQITVKVARKTVEVDHKQLQWVVFMDSTGEVPGEISLSKRNAYLKKYDRIHVTVCWLQNGEKGKKLYVDQWYPVTDPAVAGLANYEAQYHSDWGNPDVSEALEWQAVRREEIKGKCRHGVVCAMIKSGTGFNLDTQKELVNKIVDFIVTGE